MTDKKLSPLQSGFLLSGQEKKYILIICAVFLLGLITRYWYLKHEKPREYTPEGIEQVDKNRE
ncbi:MAG: hypothetical protein GXY61_10510 [Lentisphaerae bacterium]|jgi:hypothetical protein|nr:hypothetical protein [Lentisphaerota bacterium]